MKESHLRSGINWWGAAEEKRSKNGRKTRAGCSLYIV